MAPAPHAAGMSYRQGCSHPGPGTLVRDALTGLTGDGVAASATWVDSVLSPHCVQAAEEKNRDINL